MSVTIGSKRRLCTEEEEEVWLAHLTSSVAKQRAIDHINDYHHAMTEKEQEEQECIEAEYVDKQRKAQEQDMQDLEREREEEDEASKVSSNSKGKMKEGKAMCQGTAGDIGTDSNSNSSSINNLQTNSRFHRQKHSM